jgi:hypothetical protein
MSTNHTKLGKKEQVVRHDGMINEYQYMIDPTLSAEELESCKKIDYVPARWVLVNVILPTAVNETSN